MISFRQYNSFLQSFLIQSLSLTKISNMLLTQFQAMLQFYVNMFFFEWAKISIFNILYIFYKIVGDRNFGFIICF